MRRRLLQRTGMVLVSLSLTGCLIIPTDYYTAHSRRNTAETPVDAIVPGTTTRKEVLLRLGEPDAATVDEAEFWYDAEKVKAIIIVGDRGGELIRHYLLIIRFDGRGVVESQRVEDLSDLPPH